MTETDARRAINVEIPRDFAPFVESMVSQGRYPDTNAVLAESLRLLESQEKLRAEVREGFAQFDRGEGIDADIVYREVEAVIEQVAREQSKD